MMNIAFDKFTDGLVPAIIQDAKTLKVLMLGYMNEEAFNKTKREEISKLTLKRIQNALKYCKEITAIISNWSTMNLELKQLTTSETLNLNLLKCSTT